MIELKKGDGFSHQSPELRPEVKAFQRALVKAGYPVDTDGFFGDGTVSVLLRFQKEKGLDVSGVVDADTWAALNASAEILKGFRGDLAWVHAREGFSGRAYWPGGESGVTLDPGMDLGFASFALVEKLYGEFLSSDQFDAVKRIAGIKGDAAKAALGASPVLGSIRITREQSDTIFPFAADPYWEKICRRFDTLAHQDTFAPVQTVMLSLSYNRGAGNRGLEILRAPLEAEDWAEVATLVGQMQQDHKLEGIRKRRRMESELILSHLG